jgi:hypothetical protein
MFLISRGKGDRKPFQALKSSEVQIRKKKKIQQKTQ